MGLVSLGGTGRDDISMQFASRNFISACLLSVTCSFLVFLAVLDDDAEKKLLFKHSLEF